MVTLSLLSYLLCMATRGFKLLVSKNMVTLGLIFYLFCMAIRGFKLLVSKNMDTMGLPIYLLHWACFFICFVWQSGALNCW